eukprot:4673440-Pyramimonas_sp.AAC.1
MQCHSSSVVPFPSRGASPERRGHRNAVGFIRFCPSHPSREASPERGCRSAVGFMKFHAPRASPRSRRWSQGGVGMPCDLSGFVPFPTPPEGGSA